MSVWISYLCHGQAHKEAEEKKLKQSKNISSKNGLQRGQKKTNKWKVFEIED